MKNYLSLCKFSILFLACPASGNILEITGTNKSFYNWTQAGSYPTALDNVNGVVPVVCNYSSNSFPIGNTLVICTAKDAAGNVASCNFTVHVKDNTPPRVTCPANVIIYSLSSTNNASWPLPNATDNVGVVSTQIYENVSPLCSANVICQATSTTITSSSVNMYFDAYDAAGNLGQCTWLIQVVAPVAKTPPTFTSGCLNTTHVYTISFFTDYGKSTAVVNYPQITASDPVLGPIPTSTTSIPSGYIDGSMFPVGKTLINVTAKGSSGLIAFCTFFVDIIDNQPPTIAGCNYNNSYATNTTTGIHLNNTQIVTSSSCLGLPNCFPSLSATDNVPSGLMTWFTMISPTGVAINSATSTVNFSFPQSVPFGVSEVIFTAMDAAGNKAICTEKVNVADKEPPTIYNCYSVIVNTTLNAATGIPPCPNVYATDNVFLANFTLTPSLVPGSNCGTNLAIGTTTFEAVAFDISGNRATCSFVIQVKDTQPPTIISCPSSIVTQTELNKNSTLVSWASPTVVDNSGQAVIITYAPASAVSGSRFYFGTTNIVIFFTDPYGNFDSCSFSVQVQDKQPPTISNCPSNNSYTQIYSNYTLPGKDYGVYTVPQFTYYDNVQISSIQYVPSLSSQYLSVRIYSFVFQATDSSGNIATCPFEIKIIDNQAPVISGCPYSNSTYNATFYGNTSIGQNYGPVSFPLITATDNVPTGLTTQLLSSRILPVGITAGQTSALFPFGITNVEFRAVDGSGNLAICNFTIVVRDFEAPKFTFCPSSFVAYTNSTKSSIGYATWSKPVASDNVGVVAVNSSYSPGSSTKK